MIHAGLSLLQATEIISAAPMSIPSTVQGQPCAIGQRHRRMQVLVTTRRLMTESSLSALTMKEIARQSGVSIQTLYNMFGSRNGLLSMVICDEVRRSADCAIALPDYPNPIVAFSDMSFHVVARWPRFCRNALELFCPSSGEIYRDVKQFATTSFRRMLLGMTRRQLLKPDAKIAELSSILATLHIAAEVDWLKGLCKLEDLRFELCTRSGYLIELLCEDEAANRQQVWMKGHVI